MNQITRTLSMLAFALVFMTGAAFAQERPSTATITQTSSNSEAVINQVINTSQQKAHNQATVDQTGDYHYAKITQNNKGQYAAQNVSDPNKNNYGNYAEITQTGNVSGAAADRNYATITQTVGSDQQAFLMQNGLRNDAGIYQRKGNLFGSFENLLNAGIQNGNDNELIVNQTANYNDAGASQYGDGNFAQITQFVSGDARILQDGVDGGTGNDATISQFARDEAEVQQMGDEHMATITQERKGRRGPGGDNVAKVVQNLDASTATVTQSGSFNTVNAYQEGSILTATQTGSSNAVVGLGGLGTANVIGGSLTVDQTNNGNMAYIDMQSGGTATVTQNGTSNMAEVVQN